MNDTRERSIRFVSYTALKIIDMVTENKITKEAALELLDTMKSNGFLDTHDKFFDSVKNLLTKVSNHTSAS